MPLSDRDDPSKRSTCRRSSRARRTHKAAPEPLEMRLALSGPGDPPEFDFDSSAWTEDWPLADFLQILSTTPADGSVLSAPPSAVRVQFDRPLDEFSLGLNDIRLERLDADGNVVWTSDDGNTTLVSTLDLDGVTLLVELPGSLTLEPGSYRIVLSENAFLSGLDFSMLETFGEAVTLASFTLARQGVRLEDAIDLGTIGPNTRPISGFLNFELDPGHVRLYRFRLAPGHQWRFGAEITAQRDGSPLDAALALFDAHGRVLATQDVGLLDAPNDPYLFAGLAPGVYYIGVSGVGNIPGRPGGYDPAVGLPESRQFDRASGPFRLHMVADRVLQPTRLIDFALRYDDPFDPTPSGFHLQFNSLVFPFPKDPDDPTGEPMGVRLQDQNGKTWALVADLFEVNAARLQYSFFDRLPPGQYTLRLPLQHKLVDLAGRAPVADGLPAGVLATFTVHETRPPHATNNLGIAFQRELKDGFGATATLQPGETIAYRLVATRSQLLRLKLRSQGGAALVQVLSPTSSTLAFELEPRQTARESTRLIQAFRGSIIVRIQAAGNAPVEVRWTFATTASDNERLLLNANGQGPALQLRFIAPASSTATASLGDPGAPTLADPAPGPAPTIPPTNAGGSGSVSVITGIVTSPIVLPSVPVNPGTPVVDPAPTTPGATPAAPSSSQPLKLASASGLLMTVGGQPVGRFESPASTSALAASVAAIDTQTAADPGFFASPGQDGSPDMFTPGSLIGLNPAPSPEATEARVEQPDTTREPGDLPSDQPPAETTLAALDPIQPFQGLTDWLAEALHALLQHQQATEHAPLAPGRPIQPAGLAPFQPGSTQSALSTTNPLRNDLASPVAAAVAVAGLIEARRRLIVWLGKRRGMPALKRSATREATTHPRPHPLPISRATPTAAAHS